MSRFITIIIIFLAVSICNAQNVAEKLCKKWQLINIVEFSQEYTPKPEQKGDTILFNQNKTFTGLLNGIAFKGTWAENAGKLTLTAAKDSEAKVNWIRVDLFDGETLKFTYQAPNLIKTTYVMEVAENTSKQ